MFTANSPVLSMPLRTALAPVRLAALALALILYGLFSAPAPPAIGTAELLMALAGLAAVGLGGPLSVVLGQTLGHADPFRVLASLAFLVLLWPPLVAGMLTGWSLGDVVRDVLPLAFLFLPLLLHPSIPALPERMTDCLAHALALAGVGFALRWWIDSGGTIHAVGRAAHGDGDMYLLNSAAVSFAAVWAVLKGVPLLPRGPARAAIGVMCLIGALVCLAALTAAVHRGALFFTLAALMVAGLLWGASRPGRLIVCGGLLAIALVVWGGSMDGAIDLLLAKTDAVGLNRRGTEFMVVLRQVTGSPVDFVFGKGWGALLANPAVGGIQVSFTHSAAGYFLFKTGALGLCGFLLYLVALMPLIRRVIVRRPDLFLACAPPVMSGLLLHTSYKYLCFGVCLCILMIGAGARSQRAG